MRILSLVILVSVLTAPHLVYAEEDRQLYTTVAYLMGKSPKTQRVGDQEVEVWIRKQRESSPQPLEVVSHSGTGFWVADKDRVYLTTAEHVARSVSQDTVVVISKRDGTALPIKLGDITTTKTASWTYHSHADVAAIQVSLPTNIPGQITLIPIAALGDTLTAPSREVTLTVVGFPLSLGVGGMFSPITKVTHSASDIFTYARFDNGLQSQVYILDDPTASGFSGAPVCQLPTIRIGVMTAGQGAFKVEGLVHGNYGDPTGSKFAAITPAKYILETIKEIP